MTRKILAERIKRCLSERPGLLAREISLRVQADKKEINSVLYSELKNVFHQDDNFCWWPNKESTESIKAPVGIMIKNEPVVEVEVSMNAVVDETEDDKNYLLTVLEKTRQKLLDHTRRNRLLNYKETGRDIAIIDEMSDLVFDSLVLNSKSFYFDFFNEDDREAEKEDLFDETEPNRTLPQTQPINKNLDARYSDDRLQTPFSEKELERRLRRLYLEHRTLIEETGANSLFIAMGFLEWSDSEDEPRPMRSPLLLVPVRLNREGSAGQAKYSLTFDDGALDTNYSLIEKVKNNFDLNLPELEELEKPEAYWSRINDAVVRRKDAGWHVVHEMALGLFKFNKQVMWHDLDPKRWPAYAPLVDKKVLKRILLGPKEGESEPGQIFEEYPQDGDEHNPDIPNISLIRDADSSQYSAIIDSITSKTSLVIEGPPGTGKSQTITNLIATALGDGLSVLFVAEKMAALEVVYNRLEESGLGPFCLQLHGLKTSKKDLLGSVAQRIDYKVSSPENLKQKEVLLLQTRNELIAYSKILTESVGPDELPLYDVAWRIEVLRQDLPDEIDELEIAVDCEVTYENFNAFKNQLNDLGDEWSAIPEEARYAWAGYLPSKYKEKFAQAIIDVNQPVIESLIYIDNYLYEQAAQDTAPLLFEAGRCLALAETLPGKAFKELPIGINSRIIYNVVSKNALAEYQGLINFVKEYLDDVNEVNKTFDFSHQNSNKYAFLLNLHSTTLANIALNSSVAINQLQEEKRHFLGVVTHLESLADGSKYVLDILNRVARTLEDYSSILIVADDLVDGPTELSLHANLQHVKTSIANYLTKAKEEYSELEKRTLALNIFDVSRVQSPEEIDGILKTIEANISNFFSIFNGDYRVAKKKIKLILTESGNFDKSVIFVDKLRDLYELTKDIEDFGINIDFKVALGELFLGMNTDWSKLDSLVSFSQKLRKKVGVENARNILSDWDAHVDTTTEIKDNLIRSLQEINKFGNAHPFPDSMWIRPVVEIASTLKPWLDKIQSADGDLNHTWCRSTTTLGEAKDAFILYKKAIALENDVEKLPEFSTLLNGKWQKSSTDYSKLEQINQWLNDTLSVPGMHISVLSWLINEDGIINNERYINLHSRMYSFSESWNDGIQTLSQYGTIDIKRWLGGNSQTIKGLIEKLQKANATVTSLPLMMRWAHTSKNVDEKGFGIISEYVSEEILRNKQCGKVYEYMLYKKIYRGKIESNELLLNFSVTHYQNIRDRFSKLDREIMDVNAAQIAAKLVNTDVPVGNGSGRVGTHTQKRLLVNEANKKTKHIPIRQLVRRSGEALQALKPCFLMSPLSVAQYLSPGDINFDLVIMDEASQLRPEDALGAIARADKAIIVGDPKQLPPTSFFDSSASSSDDDEEVTILDDTEAILDVCLKQFPYRRLRWHYRSEHESLIQFSNEQFYDGDLIVFPSPKRESRDYGVHYNYIDTPSYKRGRNRKEAEIVVENIIHHFHRHSKKSLGVAAFNKAQAEEISILLDRARQKDPAIDKLISEQDQSAPLFIKNLENVQGDERDVIFISTTYGPEEPGAPVAQRFGPINSDLGWRRLNVIATRAKQRVELFTSLRPTDIRVGENSKKGARAFRDYLDYALTGKVPERGLATGKAPDSEFEVAVINLINQLGYECAPQVGVAGFFIDIGVVNPDRPGEYLLGIECDGATYHSSISVRDRDRLRQDILESKGWFIHRIWSTNWFHTRTTEIDRLKRVIEDKLAEDRRSYTAIADYEEIPEVINEAAFATEEEIDQENVEEGILLEEALERFWLQNIQPLYPDRSRSILSEKMIEVLVNKRPTNKDEWFLTIPTELRQSINSDEGEFRQDVFEIIDEYELI